MEKDERLYELAKQIFLKASINSTFLTDSNEAGFKSSIANSIKIAKFFIEEFDGQTKG